MQELNFKFLNNFLFNIYFFFSNAALIFLSGLGF